MSGNVMDFFSVEVTCPDCRSPVVKLPRPVRPLLFAPEWSAIPCPQCGRNLSVEAKQELAAREAKEAPIVIAIGAALIGLVVLVSWQLGGNASHQDNKSRGTQAGPRAE